MQAVHIEELKHSLQMLTNVVQSWHLKEVVLIALKLSIQVRHTYFEVHVVQFVIYILQGSQILVVWFKKYVKFTHKVQTTVEIQVSHAMIKSEQSWHLLEVVLTIF